MIQQKNPRLFLAAICLSLPLFACNKISKSKETGHEDATLDQLTDKLIDCVNYDDEKVGLHMQGMPTGFLADETWKNGELVKVKNSLTGIPRDYIKWLFDVHEKNGFTISQENLGGGIIGITYFSDLPQRINISTETWAVNFALQHEVGHAMNVRFNNEIRGFEDAIEKVFSAEGSNDNFRSYAQSSSMEYFAESFNNYYCSPAANAFMKKEAPKTHALFQEHLKPPRWEETPVVNPTPIPSPIPGSPSQLFVALPSSPVGASPYLYISAPQTSSGVSVCLGDRSICTKITVDQTFFLTNSLGVVTDRRIFTGPLPSALALAVAGGQGLLTITTLDPNNAPTASRVVRLTKLSY